MRVGGEAEEDGDGGGGGGGGEVKEGASESSPPSRAPLKTILTNFLNHVATLEAQQHDEEGENTYEKEFQELKSFSDHLRTQPDFGCGQGELEVNRKKNRYKDILPFDASRVVLSEYPGVPGSDYINANHIKGASGSNAYIAAQGPLPHTVNDFWRMVVETEVQVIVMACNETEAGKHKCERYWNEPEEDGGGADGGAEGESEKQFGKYFVKTLKMREICPDFLVRTMRLRWTPDEKKGEEERTVCQFHYSAWPDHGIPLQVKPLLEMVRLIRDCQASETLPVLVHCSAGCGRTGTICAIDFIWGLLRTGKLTGDFSLFELVRDMRRQRIAMVQTVDQYILVHRAVRELFLEQMRVIDSHPYENVDDDGNPLCKVADEVTPEYETIFVKGNESKEKSPADFDRILSARMSQQQQQPRRTVMGTAMLSRDNRSPLHKTSSNDSSSGGEQQQRATPPPPLPPPKLRNNIDSAAIDTRKVEVTDRDAADLAPIEDLTRPKDPVLFEPAGPTDAAARDVTAAQRFKKGNLRLMKTDNGSWKLQELEEAIAKIPEKKSEGKAGRKKKKSKDGSSGPGDDKGGGGGLMRRPSIKRIKAFFSNKESKEGSAGPSSAKSSPPDEEEYGSTTDESPASDSELAAALSKMPKLEMGDPDPLLTTSSSGPSSLSVPNSLDRRAARNPDYANLEIHRGGVGEIGGGGGAADSKFWSLSSKGKGGQQEQQQQTTSTPSLKSSHSSDRLPLPADHPHASHRPALPIKRSKSMKIDSRSISLADQKEELAMAMSLYQVPPRPKRSSTETFENFQSLPSSNNAKERTPPPPTKPRRSNNNASHSEFANSVNDSVPDAPPRKHSNDYANVRVKSRPSPPEKSYIEQQLIKLHERITTSVAIPSELKRTLPLIARSSDSLDEDAKKMLKDCQEYLRASLEMADSKERVLQHHRSAESSPMTTLQKTSSRGHLFSSHSSPSNSYNKYGSGRTPPSAGKSTISPTGGAVQKGICVPPNRPQDAHVHVKQPSPPLHKGGEQRTSPPRAAANSSHYENVAMTAQRKVTDSALTAASKTKQRPPTRERRNSFREAVENRGKENSGEEDDDADSGAPKKSYESIWFGKEQLSSTDYHTYENSPPRHQQQQQQQQPGPSFRPQRTSASSLGRQAVLNSSSVPSYDRKSPTPTSGESGGYEPVNFRKLSMEGARGRQLYQNSANNSQLQSVGLVSEVINRQQLQQQQQHEHSRLSDMSPSSPVRSPPPLLAAKTSPLRSPPSHTSPQQTMPQPPPYKSPPNPSRMMAMSRTSPTIGNPPSSGLAVAAPQQRQKVSPKRVMQQFPSSSTTMTAAPSSASPPNSRLQRDLQHQNYVNVQVARRHSRDTGKSPMQTVEKIEKGVISQTLKFSEALFSSSAARPASSSAAAAINAKDDLAIAQRRMQQQRSRRSASQAAVNRLSLGDFATTFATPAPKSLPPNSINYDPLHGTLFNTRLNMCLFTN